jgi:hypothetical protein
MQWRGTTTARSGRSRMIGLSPWWWCALSASLSFPHRVVRVWSTPWGRGVEWDRTLSVSVSVSRRQHRGTSTGTERGGRGGHRRRGRRDERQTLTCVVECGEYTTRGRILEFLHDTVYVYYNNLRHRDRRSRSTSKKVINGPARSRHTGQAGLRGWVRHRAHGTVTPLR